MRISIALVFGGELIALIGIGLWSVAAALVILGVQLAAIGMMRESRAAAQTSKSPKRAGRVAAGVHRRRASIRRFADRARPALRLVGKAAS